MKNGLKKFVNKWFQCSKILVFITAIIFGITLYKCMSVDITSVIDATIPVTAITVTGSIFLSALVWYLKKSQAEFISNKKIEHVKLIGDIEFKNYERKIRLRRELGITDEEDAEISESSVIDDMYSDAVNKDSSYIDESFDNAASDPEIQSV